MSSLAHSKLAYEVVEGWEHLPDGMAFTEVAGVAVDSKDRVYLFCRGRHPVLVFDKDGHFLSTWGEGTFANPHGITITRDDRVFLVDDAGALVSGSLTTAIVADSMLTKHPGEIVLHNLICSKAVPEVIVERGGTPVRTRVGHSYIKQVMAETGACFGGEHSGHYYFRDNYRADSGIIAAMAVLEVMCATGQKLSELRKPFERYVASGELNTEVPDPLAVIEFVAERFASAKQDRLDGLTIDLTSGAAADPDDPWWFNLRPSNTEPLLRLNLEASDEAACARHVAEIRALIAEAAG